MKLKDGDLFFCFGFTKVLLQTNKTLQTASYSVYSTANIFYSVADLPQVGVNKNKHMYIFKIPN